MRNAASSWQRVPGLTGHSSRLAATALALLSGCLLASAATNSNTVLTIGGGPQANPDVWTGNIPAGTATALTTKSQFNDPWSTALDRFGNLYIADKSNNIIRKVTYPGQKDVSRTTNLMTGLSRPVGVGVDNNNVLYVLTQGDSKLRRYNLSSRAWGTTNALTPLVPTALAVSGDGLAYVACTNGSILKIDDAAKTVWPIGFRQPMGMALRSDGMLAVSDAGQNSIWLVNTTDGAAGRLTGNPSGAAGFADGPADYALFSSPRGLAATGVGELIVADRNNHRVRLIDFYGNATTIYGVSPNQWIGVGVTPPTNYPGWQDSVLGVPHGREPSSVTLGTNGTIFVTETYYDLLRCVTNTGLTADNIAPTTPSFSPSCGFYPLGINITVSNALGDVYYTTNGSDPTPKTGILVEMVGGAGTIYWKDSFADLSSLRVRAFYGVNSSPVVTGTVCPPTVPSFGPTCGEFTGSSTVGVTNDFGTVYYTLDGTEPSPSNGSALVMSNGVGRVVWPDVPHSMAQFRVRAFSTYTQGSITVAGEVCAPTTPTFSPYCGYFWNTSTVWVTNKSGVVYYTTNRTLPTTNSAFVRMTNGVGAFEWVGPHDMKDLRLRAINSLGQSTLVVYGGFCPATVPTFGPTCGYFSDTDLVGVTNNVGDVHYTLDGSEPTLSSPKVELFNGIGIIQWEGPHDMSSLRLRSFSGPENASQIVSGQICSSPSFSPTSGYYPSGQIIYVTNYAGDVYYRTDGLEPDTNSIRVQMTNGVGAFVWREPKKDLRTLRIKAISGPLTSPTASGVPSPINRVGFASDIYSGIGSTIYIPVVANLKPGEMLKTLGMRMEITPILGNTNVVSFQKLIQPMESDFVQLIGPAPNYAPVNFNERFYMTNSGSTAGVDITVTLADGLSVQDYAVICLLKLKVPSTALEGQRYRLSATYVSGGNVVTAPMPDCQLVVSNREYLVGDVAPAPGETRGQWYQAGTFGDWTLDMNDVNAARYASFGIQQPYSETDAYNAMDADLINPGVVDYFDWTLIRDRYLGRDAEDWVRSWTVGGILSDRLIDPPLAPQPQMAFKASMTEMPVWNPQATLIAGTLANLNPYGSYDLPISVRVAAGSTITGMQFRATIVPDLGTPMPTSIKFRPALGFAGCSTEAVGSTSNSVIASWLPGEITLSGSNCLGYLNFTLGGTVHSGQGYTVRFSSMGGAADTVARCRFESMSGSLWVQSAALRPLPVISDEWKIAFFGNLENLWGNESADPDQDGCSNLQEYLAGTNPTNSESHLRFSGAGLKMGQGARGVALQWLTAPNKLYILEQSSNLGGNWLPLASNIAGDGLLHEFIQTNLNGRAQFYRVRLQP